MLQVRLLGAFDIRRDGKPIVISSRPAQSLIAFLILNAGTAYRREKLAGQVWPDTTEDSARDYLRHALWRIRKSLGPSPARGKDAPFILADDIHIGFNVDAPYWLDAAKLKKVDVGKAPIEETLDALSLYEGELLPGFYDEWVVLEREHIRSMFEQKIGGLLQRLEAEARWSDILIWAEKWISFGQKPEPAYRALMSAHAANGDMSSVAAAYERCVKTLREFGVEPSEQTTALYEDIKSGKVRAAVAQAPAALPPRLARTSNIPVPLTSFIGREQEVGQIVSLFGHNRLITLMGPGGVGKTRLAMETAGTLVSRFPDGAWWVDLVGINDPSLVPQALAQVAGVHEVASQPLAVSLTEQIGARRSLLVLDNCEHLISACAQLAELLLGSCKRLKILTTSREALDILGETTLTVPSLSLPEPGRTLSTAALSKAESVRLFVDRVGSAQSGFKLGDDNAGAVAQICQRLSGIPLAIELAAARTRMMSIEEIARRLNDSFDLLTGGSRTALPRHQTLRATIDWSHDLLSESERILFRRLSVFAGSFALDAAESVAAGGAISGPEIVALVGQLINKSLVSVLAQSSDSRTDTRYRMLETVREYGRRRLDEAGESAELQRRHLRFFAAFAEHASGGFDSSAEVDWFERLENDVDNLRAALEWLPASLPAPGTDKRSSHEEKFLIIGSLPMFWERGYRRETIEMLDRLLKSDGAESPSVARAKAMNVGGFLYWSLGSLDEARSILEAALRLGEQLGDALTQAWSLAYLGWTLGALREYDASRNAFERAVVIGQSVGEAGKPAVARAKSFAGDIPYWQGDIPEARRLYEEGISTVRQMHYMNILAYPLRRLGYVSLQERKYEEAAALFDESLQLNRQVHHVQGMIACLAAFGALSVEQHRLERAAVLFACVEKLLGQHGGPFWYTDIVEYQRAEAKFGAESDAQAVRAGRRKAERMTLEQAMEFGRGSLRP